MPFEDRVPDDITDLEATDDGFTAHVSIPLDEDGYFGRECPGCDRWFKMNHDEYQALPEDLELTCPYCGHREEHSEFMTSDQHERVMAAAQAIGLQFVYDLISDSFSSALRGSKNVTYTPGAPPPLQALPTYVEQTVERVVACPVCSNHCAVYGASSYCPACAARPSIDGVRAAIERARTSLRLPEMVNDEHRTALEAAGVFESLARETIKQAVTLFEVFAEEQFTQHTGGASSALRGKGKIFQRLGEASDLFSEGLGFSLQGLADADAWSRLQRTFARRHVLVHRDGQADDAYLQRYPEQGLLPGQRLAVARPEAEQALTDLEALVEAVVARLAK